MRRSGDSARMRPFGLAHRLNVAKVHALAGFSHVWRALSSRFRLPITPKAVALPPVYPLYTPCMPPVCNRPAPRTTLALSWLRCHVGIASRSQPPPKLPPRIGLGGHVQCLAQDYETLLAPRFGPVTISPDSRYVPRRQFDSERTMRHGCRAAKHAPTQRPWARQRPCPGRGPNGPGQ
jgi:hypothetical protein